jgi:hypothetical protein
VNLFVSGYPLAVLAGRGDPSPPEGFGRSIGPPPPAAFD